MRQRLHIARGLLHDPPVVFLDEPTIGVDPVGARELRADDRRPHARPGKTVLLTTHYMFEADALCDRIAVIAQGQIVAEGTPARPEGPGRRRHRRRDRGLRRSRTARSSACARSTGVTSVSVEERDQAQVLVVQAGAGHRADARACSRASTAVARPRRRPASRRSRTPTSRSWPGRREARRALRSLALGWWSSHLKMLIALGVRRAARRRSGRSSSRRSPSSCSGPAPASESLVSPRSAPRDGDLVVDEHVGRLGAAAGALARHARAARRRAGALRARPAADHARDGDDRPLLAWSRRCSGAGSSSAIDLPSSTRSRSASPCRRPCSSIGMLRLPARRLVRPLPHGVGAREPARVPGLADLRVPRAAHAAPGLGAADLVGARADLGRCDAIRDAALGGQAVADMRCLPSRSARSTSRSASLSLETVLSSAAPRRARSRWRDRRRAIFFVGGLLSFRALFSWLCARGSSSRPCSSRRSSRSCSSSTSAARPASSPTSSS